MPAKKQVIFSVNTAQLTTGGVMLDSAMAEEANTLNACIVDFGAVAAVLVGAYGLHRFIGIREERKATVMWLAIFMRL
jgi:hypothetical protein